MTLLFQLTCRPMSTPLWLVCWKWDTPTVENGWLNFSTTRMGTSTLSLTFSTPGCLIRAVVLRVWSWLNSDIWTLISLLNCDTERLFHVFKKKLRQWTLIPLIHGPWSTALVITYIYVLEVLNTGLLASDWTTMINREEMFLRAIM